MHLKYHSFIAEITFSAITNSFVGEVINVQGNDVIVFLTSDKFFFQTIFKQAVDQYLKLKIPHVVPWTQNDGAML